MTGPPPLEAAEAEQFLPSVRTRVERLGNGLTLCVLERRQAPVVSTALWYRTGTRDEPAGKGGLAHFVEHLMFKGSPAYGPGEIDRRTQALGGHSNAFTSHDTTAYYFQFASDRWTEALRIEADRMRELTLPADEIASERSVILEEIAMYENEPWDALETQVAAALYGEHPYGRPVLGTKEQLLDIDRAALADFHGRHYVPRKAVLVVAGDVPEDVVEEVERLFGGITTESEAPASSPLESELGEGLRRVERRQGEMARLLLVLPACPASSPDLARLRLLVSLLVSGRASRLHRVLVEERQSAIWVAAEVSETLDRGALAIALEVTPGVEPARVEEQLLRELERCRAVAPNAAEVERARRCLLADWVFGHERIHQQALATGFSLTLFDLDHLRRSLQAALATTPEELQQTARRYLAPERGGVLGWALPG